VLASGPCKLNAAAITCSYQGKGMDRHEGQRLAQQETPRRGGSFHTLLGLIPSLPTLVCRIG